VNHHFPSENDGFFFVSGSIPVYPIFKPKQHERNHPGHEPWTSSISSVFSCRCKASLEARFHGPTSPRFIREATVNGFSYRKILVSSWDFSNVEWRLNQWPFQEPIYSVFQVLWLYTRDIPPSSVALYGTLYLQFRYLKWRLSLDDMNTVDHWVSIGR